MFPQDPMAQSRSVGQSTSEKEDRRQPEKDDKIAGDKDDARERDSDAREEVVDQRSSHKLWLTVMDRIDPRTCLRGTSGTKMEPELVETVPVILQQIEDELQRVEALKQLYRLTDRSHKHNRVPIVCTTKWNVLLSLIHCLRVDVLGASDDRRLACLALNNLSIPFENKAVMILGSEATNLLCALLSVIQSGHPESYLCCICLMNLTFLEDAVQPVLYFSPSSYNLRASGGPLDNPFSLLRTIETMLRMYSPFILSKVVSVEGEAVRWATGLIRNAVKKEKNASLIAKTEIPALVVGNIRNSPHPVGAWTRDSLEDLSLLVMCSMSRFSDSKKVLNAVGACEAVERVIGLGGIHDFRATVIQSSLQEADDNSLRLLPTGDAHDSYHV
uniref:Uncharacterized protein n=1 Tax=Attheya septentrionalis TaxID=420275 RepID=A0A7S2UNS6_9STRA|mmetsp:Transcript_6164/g.10968  ORF Transcript_6164/g.10968 Transcript_6164/m.10968 type:complete len:387 (+) Transcript_6164:282-1442(+)|eukprot:CAMPEP_0198288870 /NCGR_PEP_ID=MMETSP1449-20131203/7235_1 /TAXON_ID=420275 /ORGANISM="Attheya septentrionalis, Strain CCMP2084" /LENGTH=386 /DNA_ID=CAMNT_0043987095 /DNA_START=220 /DNA_END=1380 /DNA_ORIENTATION=-